MDHSAENLARQGEDRERGRELAAGVLAGERRSLARAITLVESARAEDRVAASALLDAVAGVGDSLRIGLTGPPGVGKSTFVEAFGRHIVGQGKRLAVLAVDPSSARTGGSILGDKTRMELLVREPNAFIRPSPSGAALGGVARRTAESLRLCEAAGFDVVIVETVGVGQSETMVADLTDIFTLLIPPAGGDELQGVKRGVMEMADILLINKADGALADTARATAADYAGALHLLRRRPGDPDGAPSAAAVSAATGAGVAEAWERIVAIDAWRRAEGWRDRRRADQAARRLRIEIEARLWERFASDPAAQAQLAALDGEVRRGALEPAAAAELIVRGGGD
ncbi:MAG: methylmalonyl Co-A mutase-associated GTPase MeaB [Neomegalonema sp.]|nr:methylmalonyl Co-A mutase-associated GTPase MeaB [Neomegalonema sp.]